MREWAGDNEEADMKNTIRAFTLGLSILLANVSVCYAQSCTSSTIVSPSPFMGNNDEVFKLSDGSIWQVKYEYEYLYEYYPSVVICPSTSSLIIKGKKLNVASLSKSGGSKSGGVSGATANAIESQIDGNFKGWEGKTIYKLRNGQIWQQSSYHYHYHYAYAPKVIIYNDGGSYKMTVIGDSDQPVSVRRIN